MEALVYSLVPSWNQDAQDRVSAGDVEAEYFGGFLWMLIMRVTPKIGFLFLDTSFSVMEDP